MKFKKGQKGKVNEEILISVEEYELENGIMTADETFIGSGNFTIVKVHSDYLEVQFEDDPAEKPWRQVGRDSDGNLINWCIDKQDFGRIEIVNNFSKK